MSNDAELKPVKNSKGDVKEAVPLPTDGTSVSSKDGSVSDLPIPPDGGWGWMVVFASFMVHIIADGVVYSFGIFYIEFLHEFKGGKGETAWVGSLVVGVTLSSGPIASALTNKYGCRVVTILGSIIASGGFLLSLLAPNLYFLYFSFGIMSGLGFGLIYLPAIVSVGYYFEKRRAFATGIAVCGSGVGTFIFAPLSKWLLDLYGWRGAILIQAGLILNCILCGALFRPLESKKRKRDKSTETGSKDEKSPLTIAQNGELKNGSLVLPEVEITVTSEKSEDDLALNKPNGINPKHFQLISRSHCELNKAPLTETNGTIRSLDERMWHSLNRRQPGKSISATHHQHHASNTSLGPMYRKDIFYNASLLNIPAYKSNPNLYSRSITSIPREEEQKSCCSNEMKDTLRNMMDLSLLKDMTFLMFAISNFFTSIGFNAPYIYLPDRAELLGVESNNAAFLISVIGISNTLGRLIFGWMSDRPCVNRLWLYNSALTLCGILTVLSSFCRTYELLIVYAASFGVFIGVYVSLTSVVLVDLLGLDKLTNSFGLLLLFQGAATIVGPPIAGWVYDGTGSYDASFWICGAMIAISGFMLFFIPCVQRCEKRRNKSDSESEFGRTLQEVEIESSGKYIKNEQEGPKVSLSL